MNTRFLAGLIIGRPSLFWSAMGAGDLAPADRARLRCISRTLELVTNGDGEVTIESFYVYQPL